MYNFICSVNESQWEASPTLFSLERIFEYTSPDVLQFLRSAPSGQVLEAAKYPTLFAYEDLVGKEARVGNITSVRMVGSSVQIEFMFDDRYLPIDVSELEEMQFELDLHRFELSRTHWAVKQTNLLDLLEKRGKKVVSSPVNSNATNLADSSVVDERVTDSRKRKIFISYSHADQKTLERLQIHLKPLSQLVEIEIWSDQKIVAGDKWLQEIERNIEECSIAILIVSADFLASDFINRKEIPPLLKKAEEGGCKIVPLIARPCLFTEIPSISSFQSINDPRQALSSVSESIQEEILTRTARQVLDLVR